VEQAPGVWVVGEASNIGKQPPSDVPAPEEPARMPAPHYEPATAQVPPSIPVNPPAEPVREYAMASASGQATAAAATATVAATPTVTAPPTKAETRQSLYQRLSNSPEAEAGRAKAPARAVAAATTYVQDIPSADDETIEESGVFGRAAVERILGGKLIEERSSDGSPVTPRF
jgi:DNA polymerase-3 subunit gamma/tau